MKVFIIDVTEHDIVGTLSDDSSLVVFKDAKSLVRALIVHGVVSEEEVR